MLADLVEGAFEPWARRRGLLGRYGMPERAAMIIAPSSAIHTFGMRFPIDALFVNRRGVVLKQVIGLKRWRAAARPGAFAVVEFCAHHSGVARSAPGDVLTIERRQPQSGGREP